MTKNEIEKFLNQHQIAYAPTKLVFKDGAYKVGYFEYTEKSEELEKSNKWTFVEMKNLRNFRTTKDYRYVTVIDGNKLLKMIYPA